MAQRLNPFATSPAAMQPWVELGQTIQTSGLEPLLRELVMTRAAQINGCTFCMHHHLVDARKHGETENRLHLLNATRAWDMALYSVRLQPGDRIITCRAEYASNYLALLHVARNKGIVIDVARDDETGQVSVSDIERLIRPETRLIAVTHIPTQGGLINPAEAIGRVARAHGVPFLLDACQSLGQCPVDVQRIGCDFLSSTGRKFLRGPPGTGVLYVRRDILDRIEPPFIDAHAAHWSAVDDYRWRDDARRFETWECHVAGKLGLARAVRYGLDLGLDVIWERVQGLAARLRGQLGDERGIELADLGSTKCGIITFRRRDEDPSNTVSRLAAAGI